VSKVDPLTSSYIVGAGLLGTPTLFFSGWLSDIGRNVVILTGFLLAAVTYYSLFSYLGVATQPGKHRLLNRDHHRCDPGVVRRHGLRADWGVPRGILP
jgi:hypothetical protein